MPTVFFDVNFIRSFAFYPTANQTSKSASVAFKQIKIIFLNLSLIIEMKYFKQFQLFLLSLLLFLKESERLVF